MTNTINIGASAPRPTTHSRSNGDFLNWPRKTATGGVARKRSVSAIDYPSRWAVLSAFVSADEKRFGDVLGTKLYDYYGSFTVCVIAITNGLDARLVPIGGL